MKKALPTRAKLSKESRECIQECVSEFISFITSQAADRCKLEKRKTLNGEDVLWSMSTLGFESYAETLKIYLAKYRQVRTADRLDKRVILTASGNKPRLKTGPREENLERIKIQGTSTTYLKTLNYLTAVPMLLASRTRTSGSDLHFQTELVLRAGRISISIPMRGQMSWQMQISQC